MPKMTIDYTGSLRCAATHGPSGEELITDAPVDNHGKGESFSPSDLCATALASCMATIMGIEASEQGFEEKLRGMRVEIEKIMSAEPPRRIVKLPITFNMPTALTDDERSCIEKIVRCCPVCLSLSPEIEITTQFIWP